MLVPVKYNDAIYCQIKAWINRFKFLFTSEIQWQVLNSITLRRSYYSLSRI